MNESHSAKNYIIGFTLSLLLTLIAYFAVADKVFSGWVLVGLLLTLAAVQVFVQLFFFMHLWQEKKPRYSLLIFLSTASIILTIVLGTLWIMHNLSYHTSQKDSGTIINDEGIQK